MENILKVIGTRYIVYIDYDFFSIMFVTVAYLILESTAAEAVGGVTVIDVVVDCVLVVLVPSLSDSALVS